jgi:MAGUK p55 subfamily protein 5
LKIVRLEKRQNEPLGATICRLSDNDYRISIARIIHGSISQGLFSIGDQILEINNIQIQSEYRTLDDIVQLIDSLDGTISFLLLPTSDDGIQNQGFLNNFDDYSSVYVRALFSYDPYDDMYIPCRELGLSFEKGSILHIVNRDDPSWWQAFIMENNENTKKQQLPGLIPSKQFQEKRLKIVKCLLDEETNQHTKKRFKDKFTKSISQQSTRQKILTTFRFLLFLFHFD